ncbi:38146_t:CDS:2, partial [Gigaspora margarita]
NSNIDIERCSNFLPSSEQLLALAKGHINYNELLENQTKNIIELQISQFLCGITTKNSKPYSWKLLKNALSAINQHLQNIKPGWHYILHNKNELPSVTRGGEHINLHILQIVDTPDSIVLRKVQQKNNQEGIEKNQFDLTIPFPSDPQGVAGPNSDIRNIGVPENTSRAISGYKSSSGCYAYAKPTDNHNRNTLANHTSSDIDKNSAKITSE